MLHHWSAAATTPVHDPGANGIKFGAPGTNTLKYNSLCRKMNDLAFEACTGDETYKVVSAMIEEAKKVVAAMKRMISHKYRGSCVAFLISKSVKPNEELKVG
jgi:hypothetical protein